MKTFIVVRTGSTRLPKKCLLPLGECETVLHHVIRRCKNFGLDPVVCTTSHPSDVIIDDIAIDENVPCFRGPFDNVELRLQMCAKWHKIKKFHALDCDDPFFCADEVKRSMEDCELIGKVLPTQSSTEYALGMMGTSYNLTKQGETTLIENDRQHRKWRLTLDYQEDYWLLATLARHHGYSAPRWVIDEQAGVPISIINQFRMKEWKDKQCREITQNPLTEIHSANITEMN